MLDPRWLLVQSFLASRSTSQLRTDHGVKARWSTTRPGVFTLNYDQIEVVDSDPVSQQCRGLILRALDPDVHGRDDVPLGATEVIARPFDRLFNYGAEACAPVDFDHARFYEKIDGTLCIVYFDRGSWHVATRSVPDADVEIDGANGLTFRKLFERVSRVPLGMGLDPACTYMFELTAAENQVVCNYEQERVWLLGVRDTKTGKEYLPDNYSILYTVCPHHELTLAEMMDWVTARDPSKYEGVVVCDHAFRRCKVKSPGYLALSHVRDSVGKSSRSMLELILLGKDDDAKPLLPQYLVERIDKMKARLKAELDRIDNAWEELYSSDRKTFALAIQRNSPNDMGPLMARFSGKCGAARSWIDSQCKNGTWPDSVLDALLARLDYHEYFNPEAAK